MAMLNNQRVNLCSIQFSVLQWGALKNSSCWTWLCVGSCTEPRWAPAKGIGANDLQPSGRQWPRSATFGARMGTSSTTRGLVLMQLLVLLMPVPFFGYATCFLVVQLLFLGGVGSLNQMMSNKDVTSDYQGFTCDMASTFAGQPMGHSRPCATAGLWWGIFCVAKYIRRYTRHGPTFFWANWTKLLPFLGGYRALTCFKGVTQIGRRAGMRLKKHWCLASASSVSIPASGH